LYHSNIRRIFDQLFSSWNLPINKLICFQLLMKCFQIVFHRLRHKQQFKITWILILMQNSRLFGLFKSNSKQIGYWLINKIFLNFEKEFNSFDYLKQKINFQKKPFYMFPKTTYLSIHNKKWKRMKVQRMHFEKILQVTFLKIKFRNK
jgi:hypothetical protein